MSNNIHDKEIVIEPPSGLVHLNLRELYEFRHMLWSMIWKSIRIQFSELYLKFFWTFARPLAMLGVFIFIKNYSGANMHVSNISYSLYLYSGLIIWFYFVESTNATAKSVEKDAALMKKIYFPRLISPLVPLVSNLYSFGISAIPLVVMIIWQGTYPGWKLLLLPLVILQCMILILGTGTMFASFSLFSKDAERFLKLVLYLGLFVSPVIYSPDKIHAKSQLVYFLNPMAGTLLAFRSCLFNDFPFPFWQWMYSLAFSLVFIIAGIRMYRRADMHFADKL